MNQHNVPTAQLLADSNTQIEDSVTGSGGTAASALQNYGIDTTPPSPSGTTLTIDAITGDDFISASEAAGSVTITGTVTGEFKAGDKVTLTVGGADYTGTVDAAGKYAIAGVDGTKFGPDADQKVAATILASDNSNNTATITAIPRPFTLDTNTEALKTALTLEPITGDNIINSAEGAVTSTTLTGKATGAFAAGDVVTLTVNDVKFTGTVDAAGVYSIAVTTTDLKADVDSKVEARIAATVPGNAAKQTAEAAQDYVVETGTTVGKLTSISLDAVTADNIINAAENTGFIILTGKVTGAFAATDIVTIMVNGTGYTGTASTGAFSIPVPAAQLVADTAANVLSLKLADVLSMPSTGGVYQLMLAGAANDKVMLTEGEWTDTGKVVNQGGQNYAVYTGTSDPSAQLLIDQHMLQSHQTS